MGKKRPKSAAPIYFHAQVYPEWVLFSVPKSEKIVQNTPARFISTRMYLGKEFLWQFLLISLLRSRGSLRLPRSLRARMSSNFIMTAVQILIASGYIVTMSNRICTFCSTYRKNIGFSNNLFLAFMNEVDFLVSFESAEPNLSQKVTRWLDVPFFILTWFNAAYSS